MPLSTEDPAVAISGRTALVSFSSGSGVMLNISVPAPPATGGVTADEVEAMVLGEAAVAMRSALRQLP